MATCPNCAIEGGSNDVMVDATLTPDDVAKKTTCGTEVQPTVLIGVPVAASANGGAAATKFVEGYALVSAFIWPSVNGSLSFPVADSSVFSIGQWVFFVGYGFMKIVDIPGPAIITVQNLGSTGNTNPGTTVATGTNFVVTGAPFPGIPEEDLDAAIDERLDVKLPEAIEEQVLDEPSWPNDTVLEKQGGRLPTFVFSDSDERRRLGYQLIPNLTSGHGMAFDATYAGSDPSAMRIGRLNPTGAVTGDLSVFDNPNPLDPNTVPVVKRMAPTDQTGSPGDNGTTWRLLAYFTTPFSGGFIQKSWRALTKLILPTAFVETADPATQTLEVVLCQSIDSNKALQFRRLAPVDGAVLFGKAGKWTLGNPGYVFIPNATPANLKTTNYSGVAKTSGQEYTNDQIAPTVPTGTTHVLVHLTMIFTCASDNASAIAPTATPAHNAAAACNINNLKIAEATSYHQHEGFKDGSGTDSTLYLVKLDENGEFNYRLYRSRVFEAAAEENDKLDAVLTLVAAMGPLGFGA